MNKIKESVSKITARIQFKSIRQKMIAGFSAVILLTIVISSIAIGSSIRSGRRTEEIVDDYFTTYADLKYLSQIFVEQTSVANEFLLTDNPERFNKFNSLTEEAEVINDRLLANAAEDDEMIGDFIGENHYWTDKMLSDVFEMAIAGNDAIARSNLSNLKNETQRLTDLYTNGAIYYEDLVNDTGDELMRYQRNSIIATAVLAGVAIISSALIAWFTAQSVSRPVGEMRNRLNELADGDFSSEPIVIDTKDEIGELADALNTTQANLISLIQEVADSSGIIASNSNELMIAGREVQSGTEQITATMQELASGTEQQAGSTNDLSETMYNFVDTITETSKYGEDIQNESQAIASKAEEGNQLMMSSNDQMRIINEIVDQAVGQMENLNNEANEISNLIDIINGIAQQTNLLALNASIEAARAGEQGRGFAVVAEEVRTLAEQVAASVSEITQSIDAVQDGSAKVARSLQGVNAEVEVGTVQIGATSENLGEIISAMAELREKNEQMAANLQQISENTIEINSQISEIASVSEESAAGVEETSASTQEINSSMDEVTNKSEGLQHVATVLDTLVQQIKI